MFNLQGSEIIVILLLALVVLGPEKLPDAIRKFSQTYGELKKMGNGFQSELKSALDEPLREMKETAQMVQDAADPQKIAAEAEEDSAQREAAEAADRAAVTDVPIAPAALEVHDPAYSADTVADTDSELDDADTSDTGVVEIGDAASGDAANSPTAKSTNAEPSQADGSNDGPPVVINQIAAANARGPIIPNDVATAAAAEAADIAKNTGDAPDAESEAESRVERNADADVAAG